MWKDIGTEIREHVRRFLLFWAIGAVVIFAAMAGSWLYSGRSLGSEGGTSTLLLFAVISVATPPIVWLIKVALY